MRRSKLLKNVLPAVVVSLIGMTSGVVFAQSTVALVGQSNLERSGTGLDQTCRILVGPADGITDLDLFVTYNPAVVQPTAVYRTAPTNDFSLTYFLDIPGVVEIHLSGAAPLSGTVDVASIGFDVVGPPGTSAGLGWSSAVLNAGGIAASPVVGRDISVQASDVTISVPDGVEVSGGAVSVDISATAFGATAGIDLDLRFNDAILSVANVQKTGLTTPLSLVWNVSEGDLLKIALFGTNEISGSGALVRVMFDVPGQIGAGTPLNIEKARMTESVKNTDDGTLVSECPASCDDGNPCTADLCVMGECTNDMQPAGTECRASSGDCDVPETCDGAGNCPADAFAAATTVCRAASGECDIAESCDGMGASCPPDAFQPEGVVCRPAMDACDLEETCSGIDPECPADEGEDVSEVPTGSPALVLGAAPGVTTLDWTLVPMATFNDVVRGSLDLLTSTAGDFSVATEECLASETTGMSTDHAAEPALGSAYWYLVGPGNCLGKGSYNTGESSQIGDRDSGITVCP